MVSKLIRKIQNVSNCVQFRIKTLFSNCIRFHKFPTLKGHMRLHTYPLKLKCQYCNKRFRIERHLISHLKTHTDHIDFSCEVCNKKCKSAFALKVRSYSISQSNVNFHLISGFHVRRYTEDCIMEPA